MNVFFIGIGGFIGAISRYLITLAVNEWLAYPLFPYATAIINVLGAFVFGLLFAVDFLNHTIPNPARSFVFTGLLGGFTTFSTFAFESFELIQKNQVLLAVSNMVLQCSLGLLAVWLGVVLGRYCNTAG